MPAPSKTTARSKLELSRLDKSAIQRELMGKDLDLPKLLVYFKSKIKFNAAELVTGAEIERTIEGASTLKIDINDYGRQVLRSGILSNRLDIEVDGLWFRLAAVDKTGDKLSLTFEDREIAVLRTYQDKKIRTRPTKQVNRQKATRAEFIVNLLREVKEFKIPFVIPELHVVQPIEKAADLPGQFETTVGKTQGIPSDAGNKDTSRHGSAEGTTIGREQQRIIITDQGSLKVKGARITGEQIENANIILSVGSSMGMPRKVLVAAIMTAIQESTLRNLPGGDGTSVGLFQQTEGNGWGTLRDRMDPATSSRMFYLRAIKVHQVDPTRPYWDLCQQVQRSAFPYAYAQWFTEANRIVTAFGIPGTDVAGSTDAANNSFSASGDGSDYFFYRGKPEDGGKTWKPENSWDAIQRMAEEVEWRAFFVSGTFYFMSETDLFTSRPLMTIDEFTDGIDGIDGGYDSGKKSATLTVTARTGRWSAPPGSVVVVRNMGPWNGRWLVNSFKRSLFKSTATIALKKPRPKLPEPVSNAIEQEGYTGWAVPEQTPPSGFTQIGTAGSPFSFPVTRSMVISTPAQHKARPLHNWQSDDAYDLKVDPGTPVFAVVGGTIMQINNKHVMEHEGNVFGAQVTFKGDDGITWFYTHIEHVPFEFKEGTKITQGQQIGNVTLWMAGDTHLHIAADSLLALETIFNDKTRVR